MALLIWVWAISQGVLADMGKNYPLRDDMLNFTYQDYNGDVSAICEHRLESAESQDWIVECKRESLLKKRFRVHLWLTEYLRAEAPAFTLEILYWVSDLSEPTKTKDTGTTLLLDFASHSRVHGVNIKQGVDNDTAGLYLKINF